MKSNRSLFQCTLQCMTLCALAVGVCISPFQSNCGISVQGLIGSAKKADEKKRPKLMSINIIDRNGLSETVTGKDRVAAFENVNFLAAQPYQKVMRVFARDKSGNSAACITSYHPNGQLKQYLEAINNRAYGMYREWFPNGQLKIDAFIIGGNADINTCAEESWVFEGLNTAWDESGHLLAQISYNKGELEGNSFYYHPSGALWKIVPMAHGVLNGTQKIFLENGTLLQTTDYTNGQKHGVSLRYWDPSTIAYEENYEEGRLIEAAYFSATGETISTIQEGYGFRSVFGKEALQELHEYKNGLPEGEVRILDSERNILSRYYVKKGEKEGEQTDYFPHTSQPKWVLHWKAGILHGVVKTWYDNGVLESQREISENKKNGLLTAWYRSGALMLVEEYDNDHLVKGEYFRMGEKVPCTRIVRGKGIATLFDEEGNFLRKVLYQEGKPGE